MLREYFCVEGNRAPDRGGKVIGHIVEIYTCDSSMRNTADRMASSLLHIPRSTVYVYVDRHIYPKLIYVKTYTKKKRFAALYFDNVERKHFKKIYFSMLHLV